MLCWKIKYDDDDDEGYANASYAFQMSPNYSFASSTNSSRSIITRRHS